MGNALHRGFKGLGVWLLLGIGISLLAMTAPASAQVGSLEVSEYQRDFDVPEQRAEAILETQMAGIEADIAGQLQAQLGPDYAGLWFDNARGEFVVPLLPGVDRAATARALAAAGMKGGLRFSPAEASWLELQAAQRDLNAELLAPLRQGLIETSLAPRANAVVITQAEEAGARTRRDVQGAANAAAVEVETRTSEVPRFGSAPEACTDPYCDTPLRGGVEIFSPSAPEASACTAGFPALSPSGTRYLVTAGHCIQQAYVGAPLYLEWASKTSALQQQTIGTVEQWERPNGDWAKIKVTGSPWSDGPWSSQIAQWGAAKSDGSGAFLGKDPPINLEHPITGEAASVEGNYACHTGVKTGTSCGPITGVNVSFNSTGTIYTNLNKIANACSSPGDSGGPYFFGNNAMGLHHNSAEPKYCGDTLYYSDILKATSALGVKIGAEKPTVETGAATAVKEFQADVSGSVDPNGYATTYHFEYGPTPSYGYTVPIPDGNAGSATSPVGVGATLTRLEPGTTYHYRLVATNANGSSYGASKSFHTIGWRFMRGLSSGSGISSWEATASMGLPSMASGDFTGDGKADVISVEFNGNSAYRYRLGTSNGSGISAWSTVINGMSAPTRFALGDFTGDGKADVVAVEDAGGGKYRYMLGISNGTAIASWAQLPALGEMSYPHKMSVGDFSGDGKADIVSVESAGGGKYRYMLGVSNGSVVSSWGQIPALGEMTYAEFMELGDFSGDGKADIVSVEAEGNGKYRFMLGTSNGSVVSSWGKVEDEMSGPYFFNVGKFTADGKADIVALEEEGNGKYRYMLGTSNGTGIASWGKVEDEMSLARESDLADLTGDGKADVISIETESTGSYSYRLGTSTGTGLSSWNLLVSWMRQPNQVDLGDFNADGKADILSLESEGTGQYRYAIGTANSSGTSNWLTVQSKAGAPAASALADFNADGKADVIVLESEGGGKYRYKVGTSTGTAISAWSTVITGLGPPTRIGVGDFTGDGKADILAVEDQGGGKYRYMLGISNGTVIASWSQVLSGMSYPHKMAVGDLSGDGKADVVVVEAQGNGKYRYMLSKGAAAGLSGWSQIMGEMTYAEFMDLGDLSGDGKADIVSVEAEGGGKYRFMRGTSNGAGIASWSKVMDKMSGPYFFNAGDQDGDGKADILSLEAM